RTTSSDRKDDERSCALLARRAGRVPAMAAIIPGGDVIFVGVVAFDVRAWSSLPRPRRSPSARAVWRWPLRWSPCACGRRASVGIRYAGRELDPAPLALARLLVASVALGALMLIRRPGMVGRAGL